MSNDVITLQKLKKRKTGKINMDGRAKILTQDNIIDGMKEWQDCQDKAVEEAALKKKVQEQYSMAMDTWKTHEMSQKEQNVQLKGGWEKEVRKWNVERDSAKLEHQKPRWTKPKMPPMEKAHGKPLLTDFTGQDAVDEDNSNGEGDLMSNNGEAL